MNTRSWNNGLLRTIIVGAALMPITGQAAEIKNIRSEIEGDLECVESATRHFFTWMDYNDTMVGLLERGEPYDRESMKWEADAERRTSWKSKEYKPSYIHLALGRVDGEENTRFGCIPRGTDIAVGYLHDWSVHDIYGWGSHHQPRVESVTEIVIKPEYSATIEYVNDIQMVAKGSLTGNVNAAVPRPQQGEHDASLTAIDIKGSQHRLNVSARATAMPTRARSRSNTQSTTSKWTVSGGVSVSSGGPGADIGGSYEETETVSSTQSSSTSVPTVEDRSYNRNYSDTTTKVVRITCGGVARVSRAAQINGHFYTKSFERGGSVKSKGTHGVTNTLKIKVSCTPCEGRGGDDTGDSGDDPTGDNPDPKGPITPSSRDGYGSVEPDPFAPKDRSGVTVTPSQGGAADPSSFWDNSIIRGGGCIYIDPRYLPPFIVPVEKSALGDPDFDPGTLGLGPDRIPLIVPGASNDPDGKVLRTLVPMGYLHPGSGILPDPDTVVVINPGVHLMTIDGGFEVVHAGAGSQEYFPQGATIQFRPGQATRVAGPYEIAEFEGTQLRVVDGAGVRVHQLVGPQDDPTAPVPIMGQVVEDLSEPGRILFSRVDHGTGVDPAVQPEADLRPHSLSRVGNEIVFLVRTDSPELPLVVQRSNGLGNWTDVAEIGGHPNGPQDVPVRQPIASGEGSGFFRVSTVPEWPRQLGLLGDESLQHMIQRIELALAELSGAIQPTVDQFVIPLADMNQQVRSLEVELAAGNLEPVPKAQVESQWRQLNAMREHLRLALDAHLAALTIGLGQ